MHLHSCLVESALNKHKLASLFQKARRISLWEMERAIRGKGPHFASYYLSVSQRHFPSFLSILLLQSSHAHQRGQVTWTYYQGLSRWCSVGNLNPWFSFSPGSWRDPRPPRVKSRNQGRRRRSVAPHFQKITYVNIWRPEFKSGPCFVLAVWTHFLTSWMLHLAISKMRVVIYFLMKLLWGVNKV